MKGKIINGNLQLQESVMMLNGRMVSNPTDNQLVANGYKDVIRAERPEGNFTEKYTETEKEILVEWEEIEIQETNEMLLEN